MNPELEFEWLGDLSDDCTSQWNGLILRAEEMERRDGGGLCMMNVVKP